MDRPIVICIARAEIPTVFHPDFPRNVLACETLGSNPVGNCVQAKYITPRFSRDSKLLCPLVLCLYV